MDLRDATLMFLVRCQRIVSHNETADGLAQR